MLAKCCYNMYLCSYMRRIRLFLLLVAVVIVSCGDREQMLQTLEALEQQNRDYVPFTTDSTALALIDYFDSHGTANERMRAHYILGCAYRDMGEMPRALACYNDAIEQADTTASDCDYKTLSRVYGQMADLFSQTAAPAQELKQLSMAGKYALLAKDTLAYIDFYQNKYSAYWLLGEKDSLLQICDSAISMYNSIGKKEHAARTNGLKADVLITEKKYPEARKCMQIYEKESGLFDSEGNIAHGYEIYYDVKGRLLLGENNTDSARIMFMRLLSAKDDINCLEGAYRGLLNVYDSKNIVDSISKYSRLYAETNDSSNIKRSSEEMVRTQAMYDYGRMQHAVYQKEKENNKYRLALIILITALLWAAFFAYRIINKKRQLIQRNEQNLRQLAEEQTELLRLNENESKEVIAEKVKKIDALEKALKESQKKLYNKEKTKERLSMAQEVMQLREMAVNGKDTPSEEQWSELSRLINEASPDFYNTVNGGKSMLSVKEYRLCMLTYLQFRPADICNLLEMESSHVTHMRSRLLTKIFGEEGNCKRFDERIVDL